MLADHLRLLGQRQMILSLTVQQRAGASCSHRFPFAHKAHGKYPEGMLLYSEFCPAEEPSSSETPNILKGLLADQSGLCSRNRIFIISIRKQVFPVSKRWWYCCSKTIIQTFLKIESGKKASNISIRCTDCKWFMENSLLTESVSNCPGIWITEKLILPC